MAFFHAATDEELYNLRAFDGSYESIEHKLGDNQDILTNWMLVDVEPYGERKCVVLLERSSLAVACVVGDGVHFGRAIAPDAAFVARIAGRFRDVRR